MTAPYFVIAGESKCGTTSLYEDLIKHPDILPSNGYGDHIPYGGTLSLSQKEPRFFDRQWHRGIDWYFSLFPDVSGKISGDGSAMYLFRTLAMERMKQTIPDTKIIIMLRDPIDRLYSHFHHVAELAQKWETRYPTFERFLDCAHENDYYIIARSIYVDSVKNCYRLFGEDQVIVIKSETYFNYPNEYDRIISFLGLNEYHLDASHFRSGNYKTKMLKETRNKLSDFFEPYNKQLYELIGRDMGWGSVRDQIRE